MIRGCSVVHDVVQKAERANGGADIQHSYLLARRSRCIRRPRVGIWRAGERQTAWRRARFQAAVGIPRRYSFILLSVARADVEFRKQVYAYSNL